MNYFELTFRIEPAEEWLIDLFSAELAGIGFESFVPNATGLTAYIAEEKFSSEQLNELLNAFPYEAKIGYETRLVPTENWNSEWERHFFQPIVIGDRCVIRSSFHTDAPRAEYEIVIDPKMSFGTGHHETTSLMAEKILNADLREKSVLDMGCGTGILAILAGMRGARPITAIDINRWVRDNALENLQRNGFEWIELEIGDSALLAGRRFDVILANINRNILLADMRIYADCLPAGGRLLISGFYTEDITALRQEAEKHHLQFIGSDEKNNWAVVEFEKIESYEK